MDMSFMTVGFIQRKYSLRPAHVPQVYAGCPHSPPKILKGNRIMYGRNNQKAH